MIYRTKIEILAGQILEKLPAIGKWQRKFLLHLFVLWMSMRGRYNFANLSRQGGFLAYTYRKHFDEPFDFLKFNRLLCEGFLGRERIIAFDPSFLPKSGKHTAGLGYFWSGCAGREKRGLEISGIAAVDIADGSAMHLEAVQTVFVEENESLIDYYGDIIAGRAEELKPISNHIVADAYFSCKPFVNRILGVGMHLVTRLRKNVHLRYLNPEPKTGKRGRPKKYAGKVDPLNPDPTVFRVVDRSTDGKTVVYEGIVNVKAWGRAAKIVLEITGRESGKPSYRILASTDTELPGARIKRMYACRFQQEFLFRDAKQHAGLTNCQSYSWERIYFHVNIALTTVSLAKAAHHLDDAKKRETPFSFSDIKTYYSNRNHAIRILEACGIDPQIPKIKSVWQNICNFGRKRA